MRSYEFLTESGQSYNQLDNEETYQNCLDSWIDYYGKEETAESELGQYNYRVWQLHEQGGSVWRAIFADSPEEVNLKDIGNHWTTDSGNIPDYIDQNWTWYGKNKKHVYVIEATVGPNNISNTSVDVRGNPHEKEVNIINSDQAIYKLYNYSGKQVGQRVRENMDHSKDDQAVPQLRAALMAQKKKIQSVKDDKDAVYNIIDGMMTSIAKAHGISGQKLHDMWTAKYKEIPDTWIMNEGLEQEYLSQIPNLTWKPVSRNVWNTIQDEGLDEEQDAPSHTDWAMASLSIDAKDAQALMAFENDAIEDFNRFDIHLKSRYPGLTDLIDYDRGTVTIVKPINKQGVAENMSHDKDDRALEELRAALLAKRDQLQSATDDQVYDIIDKIMTRIARSHIISGQKLHDMWTDKYKEIPDTWILHQ